MNWDYVAGYFDGEGCAGFYHHPKGTKFAQLIFSNTNLESLQAIHAFLGHGYIRPKHNKSSGFGVKLMYELRIGHHEDVLRIAKTLAPLTIIKRQRLLELISEIEAYPWQNSQVHRRSKFTESGA